MNEVITVQELYEEMYKLVLNGKGDYKVLCDGQGCSEPIPKGINVYDYTKEVFLSEPE